MTSSRDLIILERRFVNALAATSDEAITSAALALEEDLQTVLAQSAGLSDGAFENPDTLASAIREGTTRRKCAGDVCVVLCEPCTQHCIEVLAGAADDPSLDDLNAVLPEAIEKFGEEMVKLMVVQYSLSLAGFKKLIQSDEKWALPVSPSAVAAVRVADEAEQAAKRALRNERKEKEKAQKQVAAEQRAAAKNRR